MAYVYDEAAVTAAIQPELDMLAGLVAAGVITPEVRNTREVDLRIKEISRQREALEQQLAAQNTPARFSREEMERQPFLKELLNYQDLWKRHDEAVAADEVAWEENAKAIFMAKAKAGTLSPILSVVGQGLLFFADKDQGRRHLLELFFLQDEEKRMPAHNWFVLSQAAPGTSIQHGDKVKRLSVPLYPFDPQYHDLAEQNAKILEIAATGALVGGAPKDDLEKVKHLFKMECKTLLGGAAPLQVMDKDGVPQPFFVNVQEIEDAVTAMFRECSSADQNLLHMIQQLHGELTKIRVNCQNKTRGTLAVPMFVPKKAPARVTSRAPPQGPHNSSYGPARLPQRGRWGGNPEEEPKNGGSPTA